MGLIFVWLKAGTHGSLLDAGNFVRTITERQGLQVGSPDEVAFHRGLIDWAALVENAKKYHNSPHGIYLLNLART